MNSTAEEKSHCGWALLVKIRFQLILKNSEHFLLENPGGGGVSFGVMVSTPLWNPLPERMWQLGSLTEYTEAIRQI